MSEIEELRERVRELEKERDKADIIAQAEAALDGVTDGPWTAMLHDDGMMAEIVRFGSDFTTIADAYEDADARFIAWTRAGVPALIARVRELEGGRDKADTFAKALTEAARGLVCDVLDATTRAEAAEAKLATCEKYRDAYAECDRIGTQAVRDLEAKVEAMRGALERIGEGRFGTTSHARDIAIDALKGGRNG
jgi:hypothetical protein